MLIEARRLRAAARHMMQLSQCYNYVMILNKIAKREILGRIILLRRVWRLSILVI